MLIVLIVAALSCVDAARLPLSPFPVPRNGLNCSSQLFSFSTSGLSNADRMTAATLQGSTTRSCPRMFRGDHIGNATGDTSSMWLHELVTEWSVSVIRTYESNLTALLAHFAGELAGYVLTDVPSANVGLAACAAMGAVAVTADNEATAVAAGLRKLVDVRGRDIVWALQQYNGTSGFTFSPNVTVIQDPSKSCQVSADWAVAYGALPWWDTDVSSPLATRIWGSLGGGGTPFAVLGWGPDEFHTVSAATSAGGSVMASDWATNLDVLAAFDAGDFHQQAPKIPPPPATHAHTVSFLMSDGDNLQFLVGGFATDTAHWGSPDRGAVSMGWTLSPSLAELAPAVLNYLYRTASPGGSPAAPPNTDGRDYAVSSVSGVGYAYPDLLEADAPRLAAFVDASAQFLKKTDMRIVNVLAAKNGAPPSSVVEAYLSQPEVDALIWYPYSDYSGLSGAISWSKSGKPVIGGRANLWGDGSGNSCGHQCNPQQIVDLLLAQSRDPTSPGGYSLIPVHAWSHGVNDTLFIAQELQRRAGGAVQVVTPDVLVARIVANVKPTTA